MVLPQRFSVYFVFCVIVILLMFGLSSFYRRGVVRHLLVTFYLYGGDSDRQCKFDQSNILNYSHQYVEELELQLF